MKLSDLTLVEIITELSRQDEKWGSERINSDLKWHVILAEEFGEVSEVICDEFCDIPDIPDIPICNYSEHLKKELLHVASVCINWIEHLKIKDK